MGMVLKFAPIMLYRVGIEKRLCAAIELYYDIYGIATPGFNSFRLRSLPRQ